MYGNPWFSAYPVRSLTRPIGPRQSGEWPCTGAISTTDVLGPERGRPPTLRGHRRAYGVVLRIGRA